MPEKLDYLKKMKKKRNKLSVRLTLHLGAANCYIPLFCAVKTVVCGSGILKKLTQMMEILPETY